MAALTESSAAMGMERRDWLEVSLVTISRYHELSIAKKGCLSILSSDLWQPKNNFSDQVLYKSYKTHVGHIR